jgi:hypothetical protein
MHAKKLVILLLVFFLSSFSHIVRSQTQLGITVAYGSGGMFTKKKNIESPKGTFRHYPYFLNPQWHLDFTIRDEVNQISISLQQNNYSMAAFDRSKNILFFPELDNSRGTGTIGGGGAKSISIWYGRHLTKKNWTFALSVGVFAAQFDAEFKSTWGLILNELDSNSLPMWEWKFFPKSDIVYFNNLWTYGLGVKPAISYNFKKGLSINGTVEFNKGFVKIMEQSYQTDFYSAIEPEKNAVYQNSISSSGTNLQIVVGVSYFYKLKSN